MQSQLLDTVQKLNRLILLYDFSVLYSKPYRIGRIREMYQNALNKANSEFEVKDFSSSNYREFFQQDQRLESVISRKMNAISTGDYESAATQRDEEKKILRTLLLTVGVGKTDQFFANSERIYKIQ
jgi:hypothetical protein